MSQPAAAAAVQDPAPVERPEVEVRRSARRRRTVSAYRSEGKIIVLVPARLTRAEESEWVERMVGRLTAPDRRRPRGDVDLERRAATLSRRFLDGKAHPTSVRWSERQQRRWGSCTTTTGAVRLSRKLEAMPPWVLDYVLVHELSHLLVPNHSAEFWGWVRRYPDFERARGFLEGVEHGSGWRADEPDLDDPEPAAPEAGEERVS
jgi:predicted metal-dependent hydrolase